MPPKRKSYKQITALNVAILSAFIMIWLFSYMKPIFKSLLVEEHLFYGTVSFVSVPSVFGNTHIPFLDKEMFSINNDKSASFHLYLSTSQKEEMDPWFRWWDEQKQTPVPLEIKAARVNKSTWIIKGLATSDGTLPRDSINDYHLRIAFWGLALEAALLIISLYFIRFFLRQKPAVELTLEA